ncbi:MAG: antitoxin Xre/MbcA/ParS toxin-binding domain-containing protein [Cocleimonas sp.]
MAQKKYSEYSKDELLQLTTGVIAYLDGWKLSSEQTIAVLGLNDKVKARHVQAFRLGNREFPESSELMVRIDHIIGIADALRTTFPFSDSMRLRWLRMPHRRFQKNTPLAVIMNDDSVNGLLRVRREVDCAYGYAIFEAMRDQAST